MNLDAISELALLIAEQHATIAAKNAQIAVLAEKVKAAGEWQVERVKLTNRIEELEKVVREWSG